MPSVMSMAGLSSTFAASLHGGLSPARKRKLRTKTASVMSTLLSALVSPRMNRVGGSESARVNRFQVVGSPIVLLTLSPLPKSVNRTGLLAPPKLTRMNPTP